jgi:hypothetical protein
MFKQYDKRLSVTVTCGRSMAMICSEYLLMGHYQNTRTFSCSYFGDIKYFRSRFALAY